MRFTKTKFTSALLAIALTLSLQPAYAADAYKIDDQSLPGTMSLNLVDSFVSFEGSSFIVANTQKPGQNMPDERLCQGIGPAPCDFSNGTTMWASLVAPPCATVTQTNCIDSLSVYKDGEQAVPAKLIRRSEGEVIPADSLHNLTEGSTKSLWSAAQPNSGGTADYVVLVQLGLSFGIDKQVHVASVSSSVMPVTVSAATGQPIKYSQGKTPDGREQVTAMGGSSACVWIETKSCGVLQDFAPQTRVSLSIRLENSVGGWFKGRMKSPTIDVKPLSKVSNLIAIDAMPVAVPQFLARFDVNSTDAGVVKWISGLNYKPVNGGVSGSRSDIPDSFKIVDNFRATTKDTSAGVSTMWTAGTVQGNGSVCLTDHSKLLGIVTTNSMVYQGDAPQFVDGGLNYKVGGLHYLPDGKTAVEGTYDLVMRSETARCLYGFTKAPISASIAVTSGDGESKVATTLMSEKDGWLKLAAYGFTFSENRIVAKISQKPEAVAVTVKKATISCTKGKQVKTVTAIAPKCPAGYKKKL
jgi:hypothetical protein